jgi:hypothetical protein
MATRTVLYSEDPSADLLEHENPGFYGEKLPPHVL